MQSKIQRGNKIAKHDPDVALLKEKLEQFGRKWEIQSCAAGSLDPSCRLQAAKSLTTMISVLEQHKAAAHKPQTRHTAIQEVAWGPLLGALLDASAPAAVVSLALPAAAALAGFMPEVVPSSCCAALVSLLDPPADACGGGPTGQLTAGSHAVTSLTALIPVWRSAALQPHWSSTRGSLRLRTHLGRCVAATRTTAACTPSNRRGGAAGGSGCAVALTQLTAALQLTLILTRLGRFVRADMLSQARSWLPLLLDAHQAVAAAATSGVTAAAAVGEPQAATCGGGARSNAAAVSAGGGTASAGRTGAGGAAACSGDPLEAEALVLELLGLLSRSRSFWSAVLSPLRYPHRPAVPAPAASAIQRAPALLSGTGGDRGGGGVASPMTAMKGPATRGLAVSGRCSLAEDPAGSAGLGLAGRLLLTLSEHLRPAGQSARSTAPPLPLLPSAAALLCHPRLWRAPADTDGFATADGGRGGGDGSNGSRGGSSGGCGGGGVVDCGQAESCFLQTAREKVFERALSCLAVAATADSSGSGGAAGGARRVQPEVPPPVALLPLLAAAMIPASVPYGSKEVAWELPPSPLWDQALASTLALAVRAALLGGGCGGGVAPTSLGSRSCGTWAKTLGGPGRVPIGTSSPGIGDLDGACSGFEEVEAAAAAAAGWLLLRLLAPRATHGTVEAAAAIAGRWACGASIVATGVAAGQAAAVNGATAADFGATAGLPTRVPAAPGGAGLHAAGAVAEAFTRLVVAQFAALGGAGVGGAGSGVMSDTGMFIQQLATSSLPGFGRVLSGQLALEGHRRLLHLQVLLAAATVRASDTARTGAGPGPGLGSSHHLASDRMRATASGSADRRQQLLPALLHCCEALLSCPPPPGRIGPSLALHACLAAGLLGAREVSATECAAAVHGRGGTVASEDVNPAASTAAHASRLCCTLTALAAGPPPYGLAVGGCSGCAFQLTPEQHVVTPSMATAVAATPPSGPGNAWSSSPPMDTSWTRWWWAEAREASRSGTAAAAAAATATATAATAAPGTFAHGSAPRSNFGGVGADVYDRVGFVSGGEYGSSSDEGCGSDDDGQARRDRVDGDFDVDGDEPSSTTPATAEAVAVTAPAAFCAAVRRMVFAEIRCCATALLSLCFGILTSGAAPGAMEPFDRTAVADRGPTASFGDRRDWSSCNIDWGGSIPSAMTFDSMEDDLMDALFGFGSHRQSAVRGAGGGSGGGSKEGEAQGPRPAAAVAEDLRLSTTTPLAVAAPAALIAAGCPALRVKLLEALLQAAVARQADAGDVGVGQGGGGGGVRGGSEVCSGGGDGGGSGSTVVWPWPRVVRVQLGSKVPPAAFRTVLYYLARGHAALPYSTAARHASAAQQAAAESPAAREVAALAAALGLKDLRDAARGAPPRPGSLPPASMPCLPPLLPRYLLLLPPLTQLHIQSQHQPDPDSCPGSDPDPKPASDEPVRSSVVGGSLRDDIIDRGGDVGRGDCGRVAVVGPDGGDASKRQSGEAGQVVASPLAANASRPAPAHHPRLEGQLQAIAQWEQEQDLLVRRAACSQPATSFPSPAAAPASAGGSAAAAAMHETAAYPFNELWSQLTGRYPAVDLQCLMGGDHGGGEGDRGDGGGGGGGGSGDGGGAGGCPWPADCVLAVPLLPLQEQEVQGGVPPLRPPGHVPTGAESSAACKAADGVMGTAQHDDDAVAVDPRRRCGGGSSSSGGGGGGEVTCRTVWIPAHRVVLAAGSEYFAVLCSERWADGGDDTEGANACSGAGGGLYLRLAGNISANVRATECCPRHQSSARPTAGDVPQWSGNSFCGPQQQAGESIPRHLCCAASGHPAQPQTQPQQQSHTQIQIHSHSPVPEPAPASAAPTPALPIALRVKVLRLPGCDAEAALAVLHYLHHRHELPFCAADSWRPPSLLARGRASSRRPEPCPSSSAGEGAGAGAADPAGAAAGETFIGGAGAGTADAAGAETDAAVAAWSPLSGGSELPRGLPGGGFTAERMAVPLMECEWVHVAAGRGTLRSGSGSPSSGAVVLPGVDGAGDCYDSGCNGIGSLACGGGSGEGVACCAVAAERSPQRQHQTPQPPLATLPLPPLQAAPSDPAPAEERHGCPHCRELRLCLRVLLACNALMLPDLERRVTRRVLELLRQRPKRRRRRGPDCSSNGGRHGNSGCSDGDTGLLGLGCLLTAARDGTVLQLPWLVTAALEELTTRHGPLEARRAAEWPELHERLRREAQQCWVRRARGAATGHQGRNHRDVISDLSTAAYRTTVYPGFPSDQLVQQQQQQPNKLITGAGSLSYPTGAAERAQKGGGGGFGGGSGDGDWGRASSGNMAAAPGALADSLHSLSVAIYAVGCGSGGCVGAS